MAVDYEIDRRSTMGANEKPEAIASGFSLAPPAGLEPVTYAYRLRYITMRGDVISHKYKEARSLQIMPRAANSQSVSRSGTMAVKPVSSVRVGEHKKEQSFSELLYALCV